MTRFETEAKGNSEIALCLLQKRPVHQLIKSPFTLGKKVKRLGKKWTGCNPAIIHTSPVSVTFEIHLTGSLVTHRVLK